MSGVQTLTIGPDEGDQRLDRWFRRQFPQVGQGPDRKAVPQGRDPGGRRPGQGRDPRRGRAGRARPAAAGHRRPATAPRTFCGARTQMREMIRACVLYRDEHLIALNKPAGLATQGGSGQTRHIDGMAEAH